MTVRLSDAIVPSVFTQYMLNDTMRLADVYQSGLVQANPTLSTLLAGGGKTFDMPHWGDLDNQPANIASDDPTVLATPRKVGSFKTVAARQVRTQAWQAARLVAELAGSDPMQRISSRVAAYWAREFDRASIATMTGVYNANAAATGDMIYNATALTGTHTVGPETVNNSAMSYRAIMEAKQTMGDRADMLKVIVLHSRLYTNLQRQNLITFIANSEGKIVIPTYLGYRVVVSDNVPVIAVSSDFDYISYLCADGVLAWGESPVDLPTEVDSTPLAGNGMGVETLITRRQFGIAPMGFRWNGASVAAEFPTDAELATAANWTRVFPERKQVPIAFIRTRNG
jgi:hypothetical protein